MGGELINFQCRYARTIALNQGYSINDSEDTVFNPNVGGNPPVLGYSMAVTADLVGGNTLLSITHDHDLNQIAPT